LEKNIEISKSKIKDLSLNPNITWDFVCMHPEINWDYISLSSNPNISLNIVIANADKKWDYAALARNISITWDDIQNDSELIQYASSFSKILI
jgi:hypothetical protein